MATRADSMVQQLVSRGVNASLDFISSALQYSTDELTHFTRDPSDYISEQVKKWDFNDNTSPFNPEYHTTQKKKYKK